MNWPKISRIFIALVTVGCLAVDVVFVLRGGVEATISHQIIQMSHNQPIVAFLFGALIGHLYL